MVPAILVTLLCFLPTGIAAIVYAAQVGAKHDAGDPVGADVASRRARTLVIVSVVVGVLLWLFVVVASLSGQSDSYYSDY